MAPLTAVCDLSKQSLHCLRWRLGGFGSLHAHFLKEVQQGDAQACSGVWARRALMCAGGAAGVSTVFSVFLLFVGDLFQTASERDGENASGPSARKTVMCSV